jgi:hypothetical protein
LFNFETRLDSALTLTGNPMTIIRVSTILERALSECDVRLRSNPVVGAARLLRSFAMTFGVRKFLREIPVDTLKAYFQSKSAAAPPHAFDATIMISTKFAGRARAA